MGLVEGESIRDLLCRQVIVGRNLRRVHSPDLVRYYDRLDADSGTSEDRLGPTRGTTPIGDVRKAGIVDRLFQAADLFRKRPDDELVERDPLPARELLSVLLELGWKVELGGGHGNSYCRTSRASSLEIAEEES